MTSPISQPKPPVGGDFTSATFEQVLFSVTGMGPDLHAILDTGATPGHGWFAQGTSPAPGGKQEDGTSGGTAYSYHAWDKWYIAVNRDPNQPGYWTKGVGDIDDLVAPLNAGKLGLMDVHKLRDAKAVVDQYVNWLATNYTTLQQWVNKLTSGDSTFKGKAAHAIQDNLKRIAFTINDLHQQLTVEHKTPESLQNTADALATFGKGMANLWTQYSGALEYLVNNTMAAVVNNVHTYIVGKGLSHGTPNYVLDILAASSRERAEAYIKEVVTGYRSDANTGPLYTAQYSSNGGGGYYSPYTGSTLTVGQTGTYTFTPSPLPEGFPVLSGPLDSQSTWDTFNVAISDYVRKQMEPLDTQARTLIANLQTAYDRTKKPLDELDTPTPPVTGGGSSNNPFGNGNNPFGNGNNPFGNGNGNNPFGNGNGNNPFGNGNGNNPFGNGGPNGNGNPFGNGTPPPGGGGNVPPPGGGAFSNNPPGGGGDNNLFSTTPPPGGESNAGPNGNGNGPVVPPAMLPQSLSNSAPNTKSGGNSVDENGNPIDPATGESVNLPPVTSNLAPGDFPDGGSDIATESNQPPGSADFTGQDFPGGDSSFPGGDENSSDLSDFPGDNSRDANDSGGFSNLPGGGDPGGQSTLPDFGNLPGGDSNLPGGSSDLPDFSNLPGGGGPGGSSNLPGDFGNLPGGGGGAGGASNAPGGDFSNLPGGGGLGGSPGGFGGSPGAGGGFGGEGWADWSGQGPDTNTGGSPFGGPVGNQHGGMPMMPPPMMPPMNGGQGDSKERERQTWLSEDDKIWGTDNDAGNGIIGLPNDVLHETDEPLAPTHVHVSAAPLRGKPAEQTESTEEAAQQTATS